MALVAPVEDGKIVESTSQTSLKKANQAKGGNSMDKDAFMQLLVAQMKYQDPLEPTSNTEYIAQYAQFSQVEQMQNMAKSMDLQRASNLVGEEVYIKTTGSDGESKYVRGKVDYVVYENGKAFLSINESLYSIDDLDSVVDKTYQDAYDKAESFVIRLHKLPHVNGVDHSNLKEIGELEKIYNEMNDYEKSFVAKDEADSLKKYIEKAEAVKAAAEAAEVSRETETAEEAEKTEASEETQTMEGTETTESVKED